MSKMFNIYCNEGIYLKSDEHPCMLLGRVGIAYPQVKMVREWIKAIKVKYKYEGELKQTNVHDTTYPMYNELTEYFFMTDVKFRVVIVDKSQIDGTRPEYTSSDFYFRVYYQLLHHPTDMENEYNVFFDIKDTCSHNKLHKLQEILRWNPPIRHFQFIHSYESYLVQLADILMGAANYNLRTEKGGVEGKVIAKKELVDKIREYTNISLDRAISLSKKKFNLFFISLK